MQRHSSISIPAIIVSILLLAFVWALPVEASPPNRTGSLVYVVDGDTLAIRIGKNVEKIRLIGIDTPESRVNNRAHRQSAASNRDLSTIIALGKQASKTMRELVKPGTAVTLEFDVRERDKYGRLLAYAYLPDGSMINETMLVQGYAQLLTIPPNVKYTERFQAALHKSQAEKRGLWAHEGFKN
jgi:micrococcal nuclease